MKLTYVTGNSGKYISVKEKFARARINIDYFKYDLNEPYINDIKYISKEKARIAFELLNSPVFVTDSGFYIEDYPNNPGYPGAFVKRSGISSNIEALLETMKEVSNRNCYFLDCLTFFDGQDYYQFIGISRGTLSNSIKGSNNQKAKSNLWYVFIPDNEEKTLAEMTDEERNNRLDTNASAVDKFIEYLKQKSKTKIIKNK